MLETQPVIVVHSYQLDTSPGQGVWSGTAGSESEKVLITQVSRSLEVQTI